MGEQLDSDVIKRSSDKELLDLWKKYRKHFNEKEEDLKVRDLIFNELENRGVFEL